MGWLYKNKKEKISIEIDKDLYADFCVKCAQTSVNDVIEKLIKDFLKEKDMILPSQPKRSSRNINVKNTDIKNISMFVEWMVNQKKPDGNPYANTTVRSYMDSVLYVCEAEGISDFLDLVKNINEIQPQYDKGGIKQRPYSDDHGSTRAVLKLLLNYN